MFVRGAAAFLAAAAFASAATAGMREDFERARDLYEKGAYREAADAYARFVERYPASPITPTALYYVGRAAERAGDAPRARGAYQSFLARFPDHELAPYARRRLSELGEGPTRPPEARGEAEAAPRPAARTEGRPPPAPSAEEAARRVAARLVGGEADTAETQAAARPRQAPERREAPDRSEAPRRHETEPRGGIVRGEDGLYYRVGRGETLRSIAEAVWGDPGRADRIARWNPGADPKNPKPGTLLRLSPPADATARAAWPVAGLGEEEAAPSRESPPAPRWPDEGPMEMEPSPRRALPAIPHASPVASRRREPARTAPRIQHLATAPVPSLRRVSLPEPPRATVAEEPFPPAAPLPVEAPEPEGTPSPPAPAEPPAPPAAGESAGPEETPSAPPPAEAAPLAGFEGPALLPPVEVAEPAIEMGTLPPLGVDLLPPDLSLPPPPAISLAEPEPAAPVSVALPPAPPPSPPVPVFPPPALPSPPAAPPAAPVAAPPAPAAPSAPRPGGLVEPPPQFRGASSGLPAGGFEALQGPDAVASRLALASSLRRNGLYDEAEAELRAVLRAAPQYPVAYNNLADLLIERGRYDEAKRLVETALALAPPDPGPYLDTLGYALLRMGRPKEALAHLEKAVAAGATPARLFHRGLAKAALGEIASARADLERAKTYTDDPILLAEIDRALRDMAARSSFPAPVPIGN